MKKSGRGRAPRILTYAAFALLALCLPGAASAQWTTSGTNINTTNTGAVGIGTSAPDVALGDTGQGKTVNVQSDSGYSMLRLTSRNVGGAEMGRVTFGSPTFTGTEKRTAVILSMNETSSTTSPSGNLRFYTSNAGAMAERMRLTSGGNIGIGTDTPGKRLEVMAPDGEAARLYRNANSTGWGVNITFALNNSNNARTDYAGVHGLVGNAAAGAEAGDLVFTTATAGGLTEKMRLDSAGNVGVGTPTPQSKLHVAGDIRVDGNISAKYQDVAEWVPSAQKLSAGTVVILDVERDNHVTTASTPYDTRVAGVVSPQPGISLGEAGEGKALVATTGRVRVRVDATRAPIRVGDLLVTSETAGVAMRSQPLELGGVPIHRPGTIIGKALEPLAKGTGEILVLLSLQ